MRLLPLQGVEEALLRKLSHAGSTELEPTQLPSSNHHGQRRKEPAVRSSSQWKVAFGRLLNVTRTSLSDDSNIDFNDPDDPGVILDACSEDMRTLWNDHVIQELLQSMRIRMEDMAGLYVSNIYGLGNGSPLLFSFLDSLERVTSLRYVPSDGKPIDIDLFQQH
jgi:hypothetical protein